MTVSAYGLLVVLLLYLIGPSARVAGFTLADLVFLLYTGMFLVVGRLRLLGWRTLFFFGPAIVVAVASAGKLYSGTGFGRDEVSHLLRMASYGLIAVLAQSLAVRPGGWNAALVPRMLRVLAWSVAVLSLLGFLQYYAPGVFTATLGPFYILELRTLQTSLQQAQEAGRMTSVFSWANAFGMFLALALTTLVVNRRDVRRGALLAALGVGLPALLLTNSRAALVLLFLGLVATAVRERRGRLLVGAAAVVMLLLLIVPAERLLGGDNLARLSELVHFLTTGAVPATFQTRLATLAWLPGRVISSSYIYFGFPTQTYQSLIATAPDNQYLGWLIKYGLVAGGMVLWLVLSILVPGLLARRARLGEQGRRLLYTFALLNALALVGGISQDTLFIERWREFYFALFALALAAPLMPALVPGDSLDPGSGGR